MRYRAGMQPTGNLKHRCVLLGVTGGIAAYKSAHLVSMLRQGGAEVQVIMTAAAQKFVGPETFRSLSQNPVATDLFASPEDPIYHISLAEKADVLVVAPATANFLGKLAGGIADDLLTTTFLACEAPVVIAPAMNDTMYRAPAIRANRDLLRKRGCLLIEPETGYLACGRMGKGRMASPERIMLALEGVLREKVLEGLRITVTAGPTREHIDPVRFLSNPSSGKMGFALARRARERGAVVTLITGIDPPLLPEGIRTIRVTSVADMKEALDEVFLASEVVIMAAAVADYRPARFHERKLKKRQGDDGGLDLRLERTPDLLQRMGRQKGDRLLVGFAAETGDDVGEARKKLVEKNLDLIVFNNLLEEGSGFGTDTNRVTLIAEGGHTERWPRLSKLEVAGRVLDRIGELANTGLHP